MAIIPKSGNPTATSSSHYAAVEKELSAILQSSHFSGSKRCQEFLEFIVRQALEGQCENLNGRFLGMKLFGRPIDYETGTDSIVRVRANDVRRRLTSYYSDHRTASGITIHLPPGTYVPEFHGPEQPSLAATEADPENHSADEMHIAQDAPQAHSADFSHAGFTSQRHGTNWIRFTGVAVLALLIGCCIGWWSEQRSADQRLYPWRYSPATKALWSGFLLDTSRGTDVVLSDASFQLLEAIQNRNFTLDEYMDRSFIDHVQAQVQDSRPEIQTALRLIASKNFGNSSEFRLAMRIHTLDPNGNVIHIYNARDYSSSLVTQDNVILIGSQYSNPWQQLFNGQLNFVAEKPDYKGSRGPFLNKAPKAGELALYDSTDAVGYCAVAYLPNPSSNSKVILIQGSSSEATEAGGDFLLSEDQLVAFEKLLHATTLPYFEVLLKTTQARGTPITATVAAYRVYPGKH